MKPAQQSNMHFLRSFLLYLPDSMAYCFLNSKEFHKFMKFSKVQNPTEPDHAQAFIISNDRLSFFNFIYSCALL